jgi:hypothetical protein
MSGNRELIKKNLGDLGLAPQREEEIRRELGDHLEDHGAALEARGVAPDGALLQALDCVSDWRALRHEIRSAEAEEQTMNYRTKVFWLPALGAVTLSSSLLAFLQFAGITPRFYWLNGQLMGGYPYFTSYIPWLIALPVVGAGAALWSQRAGGGEIHRMLAALAPALGLLSVFLVSPFLTLLIYEWLRFFARGSGHRTLPSPLHAPPIAGVVAVLVSWVLIPAAGLLLGAVPFLRKPQAQS